MLKLFIGLLLLVNLGLYGYNAGYLGKGSVEGREPARVTNQLNADRIRRVESTPAAQLPAPAIAPRVLTGSLAPVAAVTTASTAVATTAIGAAVTDPRALPTPALATSTPADTSTVTSNNASCIEVGNFDLADARRFENQLAPLALGARLARRSVQELERHIVFIPPASDRDSAERKAGELRLLGINDFYIIQDNTDLRWGISLGMFKSADAARLHLANLAQRGVRTAKIAPRPGTNSKTAFQLRGLDAAGRATLAQVRLGFPRQDTRVCPPA